MKTLYLLRHAKSAPRELQQRDFDRPLNVRGEQNAARMGEYMRDKQYLPNLIVCSPALRTQQTLEKILLSLPFDGEIVYDQSLYLPSPHQLVQAVSDYETESLLLLSHNPGLEYFLNSFTRQYQEMRTCHLAVISYPERKLLDCVAASEIPAARKRQ